MSIRSSLTPIAKIGFVLGLCLKQNSQGCHQLSAALSWPCSLLECSADLKDKWCGPVLKAVCMGLGQHKERLSGSHRWPRLDQLSSLSAKHNLSSCRIPTHSQPPASVSHLERWVVVKATINAHMNETMEYYITKNMLKDSKVHCRLWSL